MGQVWHFIRLGICVIYGFVAAVAVFLPGAQGFAIPCGVVSLAFAKMPE